MSSCCRPCVHARACFQTGWTCDAVFSEHSLVYAIRHSADHVCDDSFAERGFRSVVLRVPAARIRVSSRAPSVCRRTLYNRNYWYATTAWAASVLRIVPLLPTEPCLGALVDDECSPCSPVLIVTAGWKRETAHELWQQVKFNHRFSYHRRCVFRDEGPLDYLYTGISVGSRLRRDREASSKRQGWTPLLSAESVATVDSLHHSATASPPPAPLSFFPLQHQGAEVRDGASVPKTGAGNGLGGGKGPRERRRLGQHSVRD